MCSLCAPRSRGGGSAFDSLQCLFQPHNPSGSSSAARSHVAPPSCHRLYVVCDPFCPLPSTPLNRHAATFGIVFKCLPCVPTAFPLQQNSPTRTSHFSPGGCKCLALASKHVNAVSMASMRCSAADRAGARCGRAGRLLHRCGCHAASVQAQHLGHAPVQKPHTPVCWLACCVSQHGTSSLKHD